MLDAHTADGSPDGSLAACSAYRSGREDALGYGGTAPLGNGPGPAGFPKRHELARRLVRWQTLPLCTIVLVSG